ncbi:selenocysteine lyase [Arenimonas soli]|uniref:Selenocysteine lyase n=1 Tax=Arenimonas soli TaxID=2269504 RepID=A0ABQ1HU47_9GAMM|nr:aminotransferase class V-fold PLP-dependent enzyme [Arenimonas soli]GGA87607.1 selenocysteine lyase [Arenimonas soli]
MAHAATPAAPLPHTATVPLARAADAFVMQGDALYLDCAAQGPRLRSAHAAGLAAFEAVARPWQHVSPTPPEQRETLRRLLSHLFDGDADGVALVPSAAFGLATAANSLPLHAGDTVLVLEGQFPSNLLCWQQRCADTGATLRGVSREPGQDWTGAVLAAMAEEPNLRIAALPQVRWDDGALLELDRISAALQERGAALVLDLSQSLGIVAPDVERWRPDFIVSVGYKWLLGARGLACLWASPRWREGGRPIEQHWIAHDGGPEWRFAVEAAAPFADGARRFDAGGLDDPVRLAVAIAGLEQVLAWGPAKIAAALGERTAALHTALDAAGLSAWASPGHAPHLMALTPPTAVIAAADAALRESNITCTCRHGRLRIAPHLHVASGDMARVADVLSRFV